MGIGSISFWQQDQNYWTRVQQQDQTQSTSAALITAMGNAVTLEAKVCRASPTRPLEPGQYGSDRCNTGRATSYPERVDIVIKQFKHVIIVRQLKFIQLLNPVATFSSPAIGLARCH